MLMAALYELIPDKAQFMEKMNSLGLPGVVVSAAPDEKCGITGTHITVTVNGEEELSHDAAEQPSDHRHKHREGGNPHHHHSHASLEGITHLLSHLDISRTVREHAGAVYGIIADAESAVHGMPVEKIHFHEVGMLDAAADIIGVCLLMDIIAPERVIVSPVHVGSGKVSCAHGILPVPAPATAHILRGVPCYGGTIRGELCTPTGAALLKHFASRFGPMPVMTVSQIGYGMGYKDFEAANCVRAMLGDTEETRDSVSELACNLDDRTPEAVAFAAEQLFEAGALDVVTVPIGMKKNRQGVMLICLCRPEDREKMVGLMFRHTSTLGIRDRQCQRFTLQRTVETVETPYGGVRIKRSSGWGVDRSKPEYEDAAKIAREHGLPLSEIIREANLAISE